MAPPVSLASPVPLNLPVPPAHWGFAPLTPKVPRELITWAALLVSIPFYNIWNLTISLLFPVSWAPPLAPVFLVSLVSQANAYLSILGLSYMNSIFSQSLDHFEIFVTYRVITSRKFQILGKIVKIWPKNATFAKFQKAEYDCLHSCNAGKDTLRKAEEE